MDQEQEYLFVKGQEYGYLATKHDPQALASFLSVENEWNMFMQGVHAGRSQAFQDIGKGVNPQPELSKDEQAAKLINTGYFLAKYRSGLEPNLARYLHDNIPAGLVREGVELYNQEIKMDKQLPGWLQKHGNTTPDKEPRDLGMDMERDDIEPER